MESVKDVIQFLNSKGFQNSAIISNLKIPRTTFNDIVGRKKIDRETVSTSRIFILGHIVMEFVIRGYNEPIEIIEKENIEGHTLFELLVNQVKPNLKDNMLTETLLKCYFNERYPAKIKVSSVERFKARFGLSVNSESFLNALKSEPQYACDIINDTKLSSILRSDLLELFSKVYSKNLFSYVKSKLNDPDDYIRSMAIETLVRYAINGQVDHAIVEAAIYPVVKKEKNEELKEHLSQLYEYLEVA